MVQRYGIRAEYILFVFSLQVFPVALLGKH